MFYLYFVYIFQMAFGQRDLLVNLNGQTMCVKGVTRYTTCDDVIEMVFYNTSKSLESYAIFESSCGVERMLYGKERILKIVRSWGVEQNSFTLVLRELDNIKYNMATLSKARRKLRKRRSQNAKLDNNTIQANRDNLNNKTMKDKNIENLEKMQRRERSGKLGILKRFLSDVVLHKTKQRKEIQSTVMARTAGDGCDESIIKSNTVELNTSSLEQQNVTFNDSIRHCNSYMNAAFVDCDDTTVTALEDDFESAFEDYSDVGSVCEFERNIVDISLSDCEDIAELESDSECQYSFCSAENTVIECERIRGIRIIHNTAQNDEHDNGDENMKSFMKTLVYDSEYDEGLSSLDSDEE